MGAAVTDRTDLPLSDKERAQWMLHRLAAGKGICNIGFAIRVDGQLRWWPLQESFAHLIRRHPGLRTVVRGSGSQLRKQILPAADVDATLQTHTCAERELSGRMTELIGRPFDLAEGPLVAGHVFVLPAGTVVCFVMHHLVADWTTAQTFLYEFRRCYEAVAAGEPVPADLAATGTALAEPGPAPESVAYWLEHLRGFDRARSPLGHARTVPSRPTFAGDRVNHRLGPDAAAALGRLCARTGCTENMVLLAVYYLLLARHGAGPDLVVGVPVTARPGGTADSVGYHVSTLPLRVEVDLSGDFTALAHRARAAFLNGMDHADASFESVQRLLPDGSGDWRAPVFRHGFNFRPHPGRTETTFAGLPVRQLAAGHGLSRLDLDLLVFAEPAGIDLAAVFSTEAHTRIDAVRFLERFESTLLAVDARGDVPVGELDIACAKDHEVLARLNSTRRTWPATGGATTAELIYRQGMRSPDADAVAPWSYARLLRKAAGLARALREAGVAPGDVVALRQVRGPELAASALAVWTVGAAYLPMDPAHPVERGLAEVTAAGARVLIAGPDAPPEFGAAGTVLDAIAMPEAEPVPPAPGRIAYLIHTSGSTGRPKAVQITHANLANVVLHFLDALRITAVDRVLWSTTFSFDISALEVFMPLLAGGCCVPATDRDRVSPRVLAALIQAERVSVAQGTPTLWRHLAPGLGNSLRGKTVLCGGEPLTRALAATLLGTGCRLVNVYGPTETTIWSTAAEITEPPPPRIPLGAPIANTRIAVRDVGGRAVPLGTPGELHVGGTGVADGYRSDERLTGERFGKDAVLGRFYRTGDRVILQADGTLTFLGRQDRQVKIRGHRLELGEVEAALERHEEVAAAAAFVTRDPDSGAARLAAAVRLGRPHAAAVTERLREHAHDLLPAAAVPERVLIVDRFPLTGNGKIDYQALVADERHRARDCAPRAEPPPGSRLAVLVGAWREILRDGTVDAETHFFLAGGHSLAAVRLAERLSGLLGVPLGFEKIFETPTPAELERSLAGTGG